MLGPWSVQGVLAKERAHPFWPRALKPNRYASTQAAMTDLWPHKTSGSEPGFKSPISLSMQRWLCEWPWLVCHQLPGWNLPEDSAQRHINKTNYNDSLWHYLTRSRDTTSLLQRDQRCSALSIIHTKRPDSCTFLLPNLWQIHCYQRRLKCQTANWHPYRNLNL